MVGGSSGVRRETFIIGSEEALREPALAIIVGAPSSFAILGVITGVTRACSLLVGVAKSEERLAQLLLVLRVVSLRVQDLF